MIQKRRPFLLRAGLAVFLVAAGYLVYDRQHITLNLLMRDVPRVRSDCAQLIQKGNAANAGERITTLIYGEGLPSSFVRLGAQAAAVTSNTVRIYLRFNSLTASGWGILHDQQTTWMNCSEIEGVRPTWHRDFYEFRDSGE